MKFKNLIKDYHIIDFEIILLVFAGILSFSTGFLILSSKKQIIENPQLPILNAEVSNFLKLETSIATFAPSKYIDILNPKNIIPDYSAFSFKELSQLELAIKNCKFDLLTSENLILKKAFEFQKFICFKREIPEEFISTAPFFHPKGVSYASLIYNYKIKSNVSSVEVNTWILKHLYFFHILELRKIIEDRNIVISESPLKLLLQLNWQELYQLVNNNNFVITKKYAWIRSFVNEDLYQIYPTESWTVFWSQSLFHPKAQEGYSKSNQCFYLDSNICWTYDFNKSLFRNWNPVTLFFLISLITSLILFIFIALIISQRKKEKEKLQFSLEMLTHEIRTPLTNLNLTAEELRQSFDQFQPEIQSITLRLFNQLAKVIRVTEVSQNYLSKEDNKSLLTPKYISIQSLSDFIKFCIEPYQNKVELVLPSEENGKPICIDPYWTPLCITNLVQNAIDHGRPLIKLTLDVFENEWTVKVLDQGMELFDPMKKSNTSHGMGLGIQLIKKILPSLNGELFIQHKPTQFELKFKLNIERIE